MRWVLDTNVVASGLLWSGAPSQLLDAAQRGEVDLFSSRALVAELAGILGRAKFARAVGATGLEVTGLVQGYLELVTLVQPEQVPAVIQADPADDHVLACAVKALADAIVSGDRHLHGLGGIYEGIAIIRPGQAVQMLAT